MQKIVTFDNLPKVAALRGHIFRIRTEEFCGLLKWLEIALCCLAESGVLLRKAYPWHIIMGEGDMPFWS